MNIRKANFSRRGKRSYPVDGNGKHGMMSKSVIFAIFASASLLIIGSSLQSFAMSEVKEKSVPHSIELIYKIKIANEAYRVQLKACAQEEIIVAPSLIVKSDKETQKIQYEKILYPHTCKNFETTINAKYSNSIEAELKQLPYA